MSLTVKTSDLNSFGAVVMDGDVPVALCRPISIYARCDDGKLVPRAVTPEEAIKNAYVFAAAPEMLAALLSIIEWDCYECSEDDLPGLPQNHKEAAKAVIAKALGEKP